MVEQPQLWTLGQNVLTAMPYAFLRLEARKLRGLRRGRVACWVALGCRVQGAADGDSARAAAVEQLLHRALPPSACQASPLELPGRACRASPPALLGRFCPLAGPPTPAARTPARHPQGSV